MPEALLPLTPAERETLLKLTDIFTPRAMERIRRQWPAREGSARFVHYTSAEAALKIIESKRIWMRNTLCMTDYREVSHGYDLLLTVKDNLQELCGVLDECIPNAGRQGVAAFDQLVPKIRASTYVASISEHETTEDRVGRLSMWRAFGSASAARVAIVFAIPWYTEATRALGITFSPVGYITVDDIRSDIALIIKGVREHSEYLRGVVPQEWVMGAVYAMLLTAVTCLKHWGFHEEREWRAIYNPQLPGATRVMQTTHEIIGGVPQLVYNVPLDATACPVAADLDFPKIFDRLIIGPSQYSDPMRHAFTDALVGAGVAEPWNRVVQSDIPIRS